MRFVLVLIFEVVIQPSINPFTVNTVITIKVFVLDTLGNLTLPFEPLSFAYLH